MKLRISAYFKSNFAGFYHVSEEGEGCRPIPIIYLKCVTKCYDLPSCQEPPIAQVLFVHKNARDKLLVRHHIPPILMLLSDGRSEWRLQRPLTEWDFTG
ncbi:hypothetical protein Y032_0294g1634 [Ancylostoma ceylanicum]|uniref:Uncharacterized protein n=1 Tax=Ancylostoma ceylanicum TaxID=53326 RepID=A0A016S5Y2_9BILA|nr:hypothetical protein Y032_0294g1634 [Ancylostoma ceylanicum]